MPRIRCAYYECVYLERGFCGAEEIDLDPEEGCLTFTQIEDLALDDEDWEEELFDEDENDEDEDDYDFNEWN
jgi:hypothetical protein